MFNGAVAKINDARNEINTLAMVRTDFFDVGVKFQSDVIPYTQTIDGIHISGHIRIDSLNKCGVWTPDAAHRM